jgi:hypothetical protein
MASPQSAEMTFSRPGPQACKLVRGVLHLWTLAQGRKTLYLSNDMPSQESKLMWSCHRSFMGGLGGFVFDAFGAYTVFVEN